MPTVKLSTVFQADSAIGYSGSQGSAGFTGSIGYAGSSGTAGFTGSSGVSGYTGSTGYIGSFGYTGSQGDIGYTGSKGDIGYTGSRGDTGFTGSKGDTGLGFAIAKSYVSVAALTADTSPTGIIAGQFAIIETGNVEDAENSRLYLWNGSSYSYVNDLSGAAGITGPQGTAGYTGSRGDTGFVGSQGLIGYTGSQGIIGYTGSRGTDGTIGVDGYTGSIGYTGSRGDLGYTGSIGDTGFVGSIGYSGSQGDLGYTGSAGALQSWTVQTANYSANNLDRIIANTSAGSFTITLPPTPTVGHYIQITDGHNLAANNVVVAPNGSTIEGYSDTLLLDIPNTTYELIYSGSTWQLTATAGPTGFVGSRGDLGYTGSQGAGFVGSQGDIGFTGSQGDIGFTGSQGDIGFTGSKGDTGLGFTVAKSYANVAALTADVSPTGIVAGQFAIIETGDVEDPENSRLYLWNGSVYSYVNDLSGAAGITGPQGTTGFVGSQGDQGSIGYTGSQGIGFDGSAGFTGSQGEQGGTGYTGSQGAGYTGSVGFVGSSGLADWTKITANYTASDRQRLMVDSTSGSFYLTLPPGPTVGTYVQVTDAGNLASNNVIVQGNGSTIEYDPTDVALDVPNTTFEFIYDGSTWHITSTAGPKGYTGSAGPAGTGGINTGKAIAMAMVFGG